MNLQELLKIAEAARDAETRGWYMGELSNYESNFNPSVAIELIKRLQEAEKALELSALPFNGAMHFEAGAKPYRKTIDDVRREREAVKGASNDQKS